MERNFWEELEARIARYDLLKHSIYQAWTEGRLSREDLRQYAAEYYHHVAAFPLYLQEFAARLPEGDLRHAVLGNIEDELGISSPDGRPHHALWMDFAESVGARAEQVEKREPLPEMQELIATFHRLARAGSPAAALAAFYAYESQVPRVAREKARGLHVKYSADEQACRYFTLHATADVHHARVWREQLAQLLLNRPWLEEEALDAAEAAARVLWRALDGIEASRQARRAAAA